MHAQGNAMVRSCSAILCLALLLLSSATISQTSTAPKPLTVESAAGAVRIRQGDIWQPAHEGMSVQLPAVVSTGEDGTIRLRQGQTVIAVAVNTAVELYQGSTGRTLQRVVQNRGSAFYDIAPREDGRLRVETPYLVAVIKGTEFNVSVTADMSTVALFEGRLQVEAPDIGDVVDLREGHIARRHRDDASITVVRMEDGEPVARHAVPGLPGGGRSGDSTGGGVHGAGGVPELPGDGAGGEDAVVDVGMDIVVGDGSAGTGIDIGGSLDETDPGLSVDGGLVLNDGKASLGAQIDANPGEASVDAGLSAGFDVGAGEVDLGANVGADLGGASVDTGIAAGVDLGAGDVDLGADLGAELGDASLDAELDAGVDLGDGAADLGADVAADLGDGSVDAGLDAGVDLGDGSVDLGADISADLGDAPVDAGLDAGADLTSGDIGVDAGLGAGLGDAGVDAELDAGLDAGEGDLSADINAGVEPGDDALDVGVGADLGSGGVDVDAGAAGVGLDLGLDPGGGLDSLLDVEIDLDPLDESEEDSTGDEPEEPPLIDLSDLFGR